MKFLKIFSFLLSFMLSFRLLAKAFAKVRGFFLTTQIYAKITAQKISQDMETLSHKLEDMEKNICRAI